MCLEFALRLTMMKNVDKLKEKAEMTIQTKGWLLKRCTRIVYNTSAEDFDDLDEFFDCESVDFSVVWRSFAKLQDSYKSMMVIFPVRGWFPMYSLTVSQARKTNTSGKI